MGKREEAARLRAEADALDRQAEEEERKASGVLTSAEEVARLMVDGPREREDGFWGYQVLLPGAGLFVMPWATERGAMVDAHQIMQSLARLIERSREEGSRDALRRLVEFAEESTGQPDEGLGFLMWCVGKVEVKR